MKDTIPTLAQYTEWFRAEFHPTPASSRCRCSHCGGHVQKGATVYIAPDIDAPWCGSCIERVAREDYLAEYGAVE